MSARILLVSSDTGLVRLVKAALDEAAGLLQVDRLEQDDGVQREFRPNAIIMDSDAGGGVRTAFEHIAAAKRHFPAVPVIAMGNEMSAQLVLAALRAGAADFIDRAAGAEQIQLSIQACVSRRDDPQAVSRGRIAAVLSATANEQDQDFALNLAMRAARRLPQGKTLFIDLSLPASQAGIALGLELQFGVEEALAELSRLDGALLESALARDPRSGLYVMALSGGFEREDAALDSTAFSALLLLLQSVFGMIVIALGPFSRQRALLGIVKPLAHLFLCCNQRFASVKGADDLLRRLSSDPMAPDPAATDLVVLEMAPGRTPAPADICKLLQFPGSIDVGGSWDQLTERLNGAQPFALDDASDYAKALDACLARLGLAAPPRRGALDWLKAFVPVRA